MPTNPDLQTGGVAVDNSSLTHVALMMHRSDPSNKGDAGQSRAPRNRAETRPGTATPFTAIDRPGRPMRKGGFAPTPRHAAPPKAGRKQASPRATVLIWTALAALAVVLAATPPAAAAAPLTDTAASTTAASNHRSIRHRSINHRSINGRGNAGALPAPPAADAQAANWAGQATPAAAGAATTATYQSSAYATGLADDRAAAAVHVALAQIGLPYVWGGNGRGRRRCRIRLLRTDTLLLRRCR